MTTHGRFGVVVQQRNGVKAMQNGKTAMVLALGVTSVGRSEMPAALEAEAHRQMGDQMLVLNCADYGVPQGHIGRLIGHPSGYVSHGDDRNPPEGLLAMLALGKMQRGDQPCVFFDDDSPATVN